MLKSIAAIMIVVAAAATPKFKHRETSGDIYAMQNRLAALGYFNIKVTGMYGSLTENIFKKFQQSNGLEITGIATDEDLKLLYSLKAKPYLDSTRAISTNSPLSSDSFTLIDQRVTQTFEINMVTINKTVTFKVKSSKGHLIGELQNIDVSKLNQQLRYPVVAYIQGVYYPASLDISGNEAHLHFKDSTSYLGIPDSEHQFNISKLLGF